MLVTAERALTLSGTDIVCDGGVGFDFWVGKNVTPCYFGANAITAPEIPSTLGYFARQDGGLAHVLLDAWSSVAGANGANYLLLRKARGTPSSPTAVQSGDCLGTFGFSGRHSSGQKIAAQLQASATENFGSARGTKLTFSTILTGASSVSDRMWFEGSGQVVFGNQLLLPAGGTAAGTAPLKLQTGSLNTTPENGALGAANADAAVIVIAADEGMREQSLRHGQLIRLLNIREVIVG